jgi:DNA mismatch repair protein MSH6
MPPSSHRRSSSASSASSRRSSTAADSDEDSFIVPDSGTEIEDAQPKKSKSKGISRSSRPALKKGSTGASSGGGGGLSFLTAAEQREQGKKKDKKSAEDPYSFLQDVRDVRSFLYLPWSALSDGFFFLGDTQKDGVRPGEPDYDPRTLLVPKSAWKEFTPFEKQV